MLYEIQFETEEEKEEIINSNKDKYLLEFKYLLQGNFLIFSDVPTVEILQQEQAKKISILEQNNQELREELTQIQTSIASLTSLITATLEEK